MGSSVNGSRISRGAPASARLVRGGIVSAAAMVAGSWLTVSCAQILGFEETTLRPDGQDTDADSDGAAPNEGGVDAGRDADTEPDGSPLDDGGSDAGVVALQVAPTTAIVRRGSAPTNVHVTVQRGTSRAVVTVRLVAGPRGVAAAPLMLGPNQSEGDLALTATGDAELGGAILTLSTASATSGARANVTALVADASGTLDGTFDGDGLASDKTQGEGTVFHSLAIDGDGKILAAGRAGNVLPTPSGGWAVRRFTAAGAVDATFGAVVPATGEARALVIDADRKALLAGATSSTLGGIEQLTVTRLLPSGAADLAFAGGVPLRIFDDVAAPLGSRGTAVNVSANGKITVVGVRSEIDGSETGIVVRLNADGSLDVAFNGGQPLTFPLQPLLGVSEEASGNLVFAGTDRSTSSAFFLTRRSAAGAVDATFGSGGVASFGAGYVAHGFTRHPNGSYVVVGSSIVDATLYTAALTTANGAPSWVRGVVQGNGPAAFRGVTTSADGRIVAVGSTAMVDGEARVDRLLADGTRDTTFGGGGTSFVESASPANGVDVELHAVAIQRDGRILAAGTRTGSGGVVYRLWP